MAKCKTIMLLVTYECNLRCSYCYEPKNVCHTMSFDNAVRYILKQVELLDDKYDEFEVQFMGGEPLMEFFLIKQVSEWLWQYNFKIPLAKIFVPTNGTLLDENIKEWFTQHKSKICLGLSFDGNRLMQDINRTQSYSSVDLKFFASRWPEQSVKMTISPQTLPYLFDGVIFLTKQGFSYITVDLAMGCNIKWEQKHLLVLSRQLQYLSSYYLDHPSIPVISMLNMDVTQVLNKPHLKKCSCGEDLVCVDYDGTTYACHLFAPITASKELAEASQNIDFKSQKEKMNNPCRQCMLFSLCTFCYGMNYLINNDIAKQSAFGCSSFKIQFLAAANFQLKRAERNADSQTVTKIETIISQF